MPALHRHLSRPPAAPRRRAIVAAATLAALTAGLGGAPTAPAAVPPTDPPAVREQVPILMYHHVSTPPPSGAKFPTLWISPSAFRHQVDALAAAGYHAVTLGQVWRHWRQGAALPAKPVVLSFDDGYASQSTAAGPVLRRRGWPGVLNLWVRKLTTRGGLSAKQVRGLIARGWEIDAHTLTHPDLTKVDAATLRREVAGSRSAIRRQFGVAADFFAYPYGRVDDTVEAAVRAAGFKGATTVQSGLASGAGDAFRLRRIGVNGRKSAAVLLQRMRGAQP